MFLGEGRKLLFSLLNKQRAARRREDFTLPGPMGSGFFGEALPYDENNFVDEEHEHVCEPEPGGEDVAPEEVQNHAGPAEAGGKQRAADVGRGERDGEICAESVPEAKELAERPDDDEKFNRDGELSPTFFCHLWKL